LSNTLSDQLAAKTKGPVAVLSFVSPSYGPAFSTFLVDRLNILLASSNKQFEVVTRDRIEDAFHEINLALGKNYDASTFAKIGKTVGAKALVRGSYVVMPDNAKVSVTAQLLDVETGRIIGGGFADIPYTGDIKTMLTPQENAGAESGGGAPPSQEQQVDLSGVVFRLKQCSATRTSVVCKVLLTSPERDRKMQIGAWYNDYCAVYDQGGNEYKYSRISIANKSADGPVQFLLVRDVPTQAELTFPVTANVTTIALLKLTVVDLDHLAPIAPQFRNVRPR
jgi:TolB-like protein